MRTSKFQITRDKQILILKIGILILSGVWCLGFGAYAYAATAVVEIDAGRQSINAVEGKLTLPAGAVVEEVYTGGSAVLIWIAPPEPGGYSVTFSGIAPGGFSGKAKLFTISGDFSSSDLSAARFETTRAILNDGAGTPAKASFTIAPAEIAEDNAPPEPFLIAVSKSREIFDGRLFASFAAQDKGTGVSYYEYAATWLGRPSETEWLKAQSPLLLPASGAYKNIYIRAVDGAGNYRVISTAGPYRYLSLTIGFIILLCALVFPRRSLRSF